MRLPCIVAIGLVCGLTIQTVEGKVAESLPKWVPKDVKDALKEMKKEQKSTKKLLSDHTCALRKSILTLMDSLVDKDMGVARVNILAELGLCSWWRDEHYLAVDMFQRAVDATGYKTYDKFLEHGLPHLVEALNASTYMVQGKFESAAVHLRTLKRLMLRDEAWALDEVLRRPPMDQLKPHERELVKSNPGDFLLNNTYIGVVYRGWTIAAKEQLRFCEANLVGLDDGRLAKRERMGGEVDNTAYLQGVAAEPVMPWKHFQLALNLYERRQELLEAAQKGKVGKRPKAAELMGRAGIRGSDCQKFAALCDLLLGYEQSVLVDSSTYVAGTFNSIIQIVPMNGSKTTQEVGTCTNNAGSALAFPLNDSEDPEDPIMLTIESVDLPGMALKSEPVVVDGCTDPRPVITRSGGSKDVVYVLVAEFWHPAVTLFERAAIIEGTKAHVRKGYESIRVQEITDGMMERIKATAELWPKAFDLYQNRRELSPLGPDELVEDEVIEFPRPKKVKVKSRKRNNNNSGDRLPIAADFSLHDSCGCWLPFVISITVASPELTSLIPEIPVVSGTVVVVVAAASGRLSRTKLFSEDPPVDSLEVTNLKQLVKKLKGDRKAAIKTAGAREVADLNEAVSDAEERLDDAIEAQEKSGRITALEEKIKTANSVRSALQMTGDITRAGEVTKEITGGTGEGACQAAVGGIGDGGGACQAAVGGIGDGGGACRAAVGGIGDGGGACQAAYQNALKAAQEDLEEFREQRKQRRIARMKREQERAAAAAGKGAEGDEDEL
ncbi:hypothetical protein FOL47_007901 [Perkinsus chesapeaki]|uniref:Uncharacterized protein n=1 Tax=Perkinsus chesapeaki TaxID=330153 RepID=A0A7J6LIA2_PERCH|nr:hypothetical protein FOL47_007901 [Perkinsus chesapeaki]